MSKPVALVTGGSRGIGRATSVALAEQGFPVAVNYVSDEGEAKHTLALLEAAGGEGITVRADVSDSAQVDRCFTEIEDALGPVGVLVNNAGVRADGLAVSMSDDDWRRVVEVNLFGVFSCSRRALRHMLRVRWGRIVNVASVAGLRGSPGQTNYAAAKAGVVGFTRSLAREVARKGITVNAVAPGLVHTDLTANLTEDQKRALLDAVPARKPATAEDVAGTIGFLCSDGAAYLTGAILPVDGGMTA